MGECAYAIPRIVDVALTSSRHLCDPFPVKQSKRLRCLRLHIDVDGGVDECGGNGSRRTMTGMGARGWIEGWMRVAGTRATRGGRGARTVRGAAARRG